MMRRIRKRGLTIIELLVVVGVLAILLTLTAFIVVPTQLSKARDARRKSDLDRIKIALYDYYFDHECFPKELPNCGEAFGADGEPYLKDVPCNPNGDSYVYTRTKKGGGECSQWFRIFTNLEITTDPAIAKIHCDHGCGPDKKNCIYNYGVASTNTQVYRDCYFAYVCNPGGQCQGFEDPWRSGCPVIYSEPDCDGECTKDRTDNRCKNDSGKQVPWEE